MTTNGNTKTGYEHWVTLNLMHVADQSSPGVQAELKNRADEVARLTDDVRRPAAPRKPGATGSRKRTATRPVKMATVAPSVSAAELAGNHDASGANLRKPITRDRVMSTGFYAYHETVAQVKISKSSGKPYALVLDLETGRFEYAPGVVKTLHASDAVTYEIAATFGRRTGRCMMCGRTLTNPESIDAGIGPICGGRLSRTTDDAPVTNAEIETSTVADNTPDAYPTDEELIKQSIVLANLDNGEPVHPKLPTGPVMVNGRLSHASCTHPRTTSARTACRKAFNA